MVGASEQIENLTRGLLDKVLQALNLKEGQDIQFARRTGGSIIAILNTLDSAKKLRDLWTFLVRSTLPGLEFAQGLQENTELIAAVKAAKQQQSLDQYRLFPVFPIVGPLVAREPRTGEPAVTEKLISNNPERLSKSTLFKHKSRHQAQLGAGLTIDNKLQLTAAKTNQRLLWPQNINATKNMANDPNFPVLINHHYFGVLHANGNGLSELLKAVREEISNRPQHYAEVFNALSETFEKITIAATRQAAKNVLVPKIQLHHDAQGKDLPVLPARPLILGADNLTVIVRGDLAIPFAQHFLEAFEHHSNDLLTQIKQVYQKRNIQLPLPKNLTASAGIAFIKNSQPFH